MNFAMIGESTDIKQETWMRAGAQEMKSVLHLSSWNEEKAQVLSILERLPWSSSWKFCGKSSVFLFMFSSSWSCSSSYQRSALEQIKRKQCRLVKRRSVRRCSEPRAPFHRSFSHFIPPLVHVCELAEENLNICLSAGNTKTSLTCSGNPNGSKFCPKLQKKCCENRKRSLRKSLERSKIICPCSKSFLLT